MKTKHTPGPWIAEEDTNYFPGYYLVQQDEDKGILAYRINRKANAKLIAAAPELLFQVQQTKTILEVIDPENPAIDQLDMIIKKATE